MQPATRPCRIKVHSNTTVTRRRNNPSLWVHNWWQWPTTTPSAPTYTHTTASLWWGNNPKIWTCIPRRFRNSSPLEAIWTCNTTSNTETILTRTRASVGHQAWSKRSRPAPTPTSTASMELSTTTAVIILTLSWPNYSRTSNISNTPNSSNQCTASSKCKTSPSTLDIPPTIRFKTLPIRKSTSTQARWA